MTNEELATRIQRGETHLIPLLWERVQRFVFVMARRYFDNLENPHIEREDLCQAGYIGFVNALEGYSPDAGASFLTYLAYCLKTPFSECAGFRAKGDAMIRAMSLDAPLTDDGDDYTLADTVVDPAAAEDFEDAERRIYTAQLHAALDDVLDRLPAANADVIRSTYFDGLSLQEIAAESGVSFQLISQRKREGLARLRRPDCVRRLKDFVDQQTPWERHHGAHVVEEIVIAREKLEMQYLAISE